MPPEGMTGISCGRETFELLKEDKPDGVTWDYYLQKMHETWSDEL